jgi:hypothetical protein
MKSMTPEHSPAPRVTLLADHQVLDLLADLRTRAGDDAITDHSVLIPAIAELEVEVARRSLDAPSVHEWIPAIVALDRFRTALALDDIEAAARTLYYMDVAGLWYAYRRATEQERIGVRLYLLERVHYSLACAVWGQQRAEARALGAGKAARLGDEDFAAYLVQCIDALVTVSINILNQPY